MGVVNVTPDSFSDGGRHAHARAAIDHALRLRDEGADILDIGGESTRPAAAPVSVDEELRRIMPVIDGLIEQGIPVSVDTRRPEVMRRVVSAGIDLLNDVNGFRDPQAFEIAASSACGLCVMHMQGDPRTMQIEPRYIDVVDEVEAFLIDQRNAFLAKGVSSDRILIDPGFGFGKTLEHNLMLMHALDRIARHQLTLVGVSRKSMIAALMGLSGARAGQQASTPSPDQRLSGSLAAAIWAVAHGAHVLRVHDVRETIGALNVWRALES
jgi:dihydropteroate synthase